jgi:hypothetical protein
MKGVEDGVLDGGAGGTGEDEHAPEVVQGPIGMIGGAAYCEAGVGFALEMEKLMLGAVVSWGMAVPSGERPKGSWCVGCGDGGGWDLQIPCSWQPTR